MGRRRRRRTDFDRRMEASVGKSPEGEQLLMLSNRSPIQNFISPVASCFLFLLPILLSLIPFLSFLLFTHHLISFFLPYLLFYLLCSSPFIHLFFPLQLSPNSLSLFVFCVLNFPPLLPLFLPSYLHNYISPGLLLPSSLFPILLFPLHTSHFLRCLLLPTALICFPLVPCSVQDPLNSVLSYYKFNFFSPNPFFPF